MALNGTTLGADIRSSLAALTEGQLSGEDSREYIWEAIATAIVNHIKTQAQVVVTSVSGVVVGAGVSGPGTGTIT